MNRKQLEEQFKKTSPEAQKATLDAYLQLTSNKSSLEDLQAEINTKKKGYGEIWATGFADLDNNLDGGFLGEQLIFLGAISSLGKTSFALQIATQIAEQKKDVLIFSLEMSKNELNAKTISRYTYQLTRDKKALQSCRLTTRDILNGRVGNIAFGKGGDDKGKLFIEALQKTQELADNTRIFIGENDVSVDRIAEIIDTHIRATGKKPFVIVDYLQILQPSPEAVTGDKRLLTDYDVTHLKTISRDYHIPVLVISAFNRTNYLEPVNMGSFRESSGIEYSSDILLAMQYKGMEYKKHWFTSEGGKKKKVYESIQDHNTRVRELLDKMDEDGKNGLPLPIELKILKNRNGSKGSLYYDFLPAYNSYEEKTDIMDFDDYIEDDGDGNSSPFVVSSKTILGKK